MIGSETLSLIGLGTIRVGVLFIYLPIFTIARVPATVRVLIAVVLSATLLSNVSGPSSYSLCGPGTYNGLPEKNEQIAPTPM